MRWFRAASALLFLAAPYYLLSQSVTPSKTSAAKKKKKKTARRSIPKAPPVSAAAKAQASEEVTGMLDRTAGIPIENPAAMVPFFEQLRRAASGEPSGRVRVLHYGGYN